MKICLVRARIELLDWLKASGSWNAMALSDELLEARTFQDLSERAHAIVLRLQDAREWRTAASFWEAAKDTLLRWRNCP